MPRPVRQLLPLLAILALSLLLRADEDSNPCTHSWGEPYYDCTVSITGPSELTCLCREIPAASGGNQAIRSRVRSAVSVSGRCRKLAQCDFCGAVKVISDNPAPTDIAVSGPEIPADSTFPSLLRPGTYSFTATVHCHTDHSYGVTVHLSGHTVRLDTNSRTTLPCVLAARIPLSGTWEAGWLPVQSVTVPMQWSVKGKVEWPRTNQAGLPPEHQGSRGCDDLTGVRCVNAGCGAQRALQDSNYVHLPHGEEWRTANLPPDAEDSALPETDWTSSGGPTKYLAPTLPGEWKMVFEKRCLPRTYNNNDNNHWPYDLDTDEITTAQCGAPACGGHFEFSVTAVGVDSLDAEAEGGATLVTSSGEEILLVASEVSQEAAGANDRDARTATPVQLTAEPTNDGPWPSVHPLYGAVPAECLSAPQLQAKQDYRYPQWQVSAPLYYSEGTDWTLGFAEENGTAQSGLDACAGQPSVTFLGKTPGLYRIIAECGFGEYSFRSHLVAACDVRLYVESPALKYLMRNDDYDLGLPVPDKKASNFWAGLTGEERGDLRPGVIGENDLRTIHLDFTAGGGWNAAELQSALGAVRLKLTIADEGTGDDGDDDDSTPVRVWRNDNLLNAANQLTLPAEFCLFRSSTTSGEMETLPSSLLVEGIKPGPVTLRLAVVVGETTVVSEDLTLTVVPMGIVPDHDRDRRITETDRKRLADSNFHRLRFWTSKDPLEAFVSEDTESYEYRYAYVNGTEALIDFFPLWLDIAHWPNECEDDVEVTYRLSGSHSNLYAVCTNLIPQQGGFHNKMPLYSCGAHLNRLASAAETECANGLVFSSAFTGHPEFFRLMRSGRGVILCEAIEVYQTTTMSLELGVYSGDLRLGGWRLPLSISPVGQMYRSVNLRNGQLSQGVLQDLTDNSPSNLPDAEMANCEVFFAHGFRVDEDDAENWNDAVFKRLWQSGLDARFWGVDWNGDEGVLNYHANVVNAFTGAPWYAALLNHVKDERDQGGRIIAMAHSLGNMLTSSAIVDHNASVDAFLMCNAAVASEAYWSEAKTAQQSFNASNIPHGVEYHLVHYDWHLYPCQTWSSEWYLLFASNVDDSRSRLTWRRRFPISGSGLQVYNFYSSDDEVLDIYDGEIGVFTSMTQDPGAYAWHKQTYFKGRGGLAGTAYSGWGFRSPKISAAAAPNLTTSQLMDSTATVFDFRPEEMDNAVLQQSAINDYLAKGVPELTKPVGVSSPDYSGFEDGENMHGFLRNLSNDAKWLHSDMNNRPYLETFALYDALKEIINPSDTSSNSGN